MRLQVHPPLVYRLAVLAALFSLLGRDGSAQAAPIRYEFTGVGSGQLGATPFTDARFVFSLEADTANVQFVPPDLHTVDAPTAFSIGGVGSGTFITPTRVCSHLTNRAVCFSRAGTSGSDLVDLFGEPELAGYDLKRPIALVREEDPVAVSQFEGVVTTLGTLSFSSIDFVTFRAVPEPSAAGMALVAVAAATLRRRRR